MAGKHPDTKGAPMQATIHLSKPDSVQTVLELIADYTEQIETLKKSDPDSPKLPRLRAQRAVLRLMLKKLRGSP